MEKLDYRKLFDVGVKITLSSAFLNDNYNAYSQLIKDCINIQTRDGSLTVVDVCESHILVQGTDNNCRLYIDDINLYELEYLKDYYFDSDYYSLLYDFTENQKRQCGRRNISTTLRRAFFWANTPEGNEYWKKIYNECIKYKYSSKLKEEEEEDISNQNQQETTQDTTQNINNKNVSNHEIRLQKQKAVSIRGKRPEGSGICYSKYKASIRSGQISYTACHC